MPSAIEVTPAKWSNSNITVLFDDGEYSVISGSYDLPTNHVLGERWNGDGGTPGFPNQGGNPLWHVVPNFLAIPLLHGILDKLLRDPCDGNIEFIGAVIEELKVQQRANSETG
jgi:hypothetical protein